MANRSSRVISFTLSSLIIMVAAIENFLLYHVRHLNLPAQIVTWLIEHRPPLHWLPHQRKNHPHAPMSTTVSIQKKKKSPTMPTILSLDEQDQAICRKILDWLKSREWKQRRDGGLVIEKGEILENGAIFERLRQLCR